MVTNLLFFHPQIWRQFRKTTVQQTNVGVVTSPANPRATGCCIASCVYFHMKGCFFHGGVVGGAPVFHQGGPHFSPDSGPHFSPGGGIFHHTWSYMVIVPWQFFDRASCSRASFSLCFRVSVTMAAKRGRTELPSGSGSAGGYHTASAGSASAALAVGDEISMEERVTDLEAAVDHRSVLRTRSVSCRPTSTRHW